MTISPSTVPTSSPSSGSASTIVADAMSAYHVLKINTYSLTTTVSNGAWIESAQFRVGGRSWRACQPNTEQVPDNADYISLFVTLDDTAANTKSVTAHVQFSLLDQHGKPSTSTTRTASLSGPIDVSVIRGFHALETPPVAVSPSETRRQFGELMRSMPGLDVEFQVGVETIPAHRLVLATRSPVFRAELFGPMKEGTATTSAIRIDDMEPHVFRALLDFIYTDALPNIDQQQEEYAMAQRLLIAADMYGLDRLKQICEDKLSSGIDTSSLTTFWAFAEQHNCHGLTKACEDFFARSANQNAIFESEGFQSLTKNHPEVLKDLLVSRLS
ncbi:unnamed protein product [Alopecurus aequalis]